MIDLLLHAVFTFNVGVLATVLTWCTSKRCFRAVGHDRRNFVLMCIAVVALRAAYVTLYSLVLQDQPRSPDETRYLEEIRRIAEAPWLWNPLTGEGPNYKVTPKMGMSYLYGAVLFLHQIDSLYSILVLNILFGLLTAIITFFLTTTLTDAKVPGYVAMIMIAIYPETLFWTGRVLRENVTLFLVPALVFTCLRLYETYRLRYLLYAILILLGLLLVRAQLVMFALLIILYLGVRSLINQAPMRALAISCVAVTLLTVTFSALESQIRRAAGGAPLQLLTLEPALWAEQGQLLRDNLGQVLSPVARGAHGITGTLILPFVLVVFVLLVLTLLRFRRIFWHNRVAAELLLFLSISFLLSLALLGQVNIRFRSTVAPLIISIVAVSAHYYWRLFRLPTLRI